MWPEGPLLSSRADSHTFGPHFERKGHHRARILQSYPGDARSTPSRKSPAGAELSRKLLMSFKDRTKLVAEFNNQGLFNLSKEM
jgi:hypothetical protein